MGPREISLVDPERYSAVSLVLLIEATTVEALSRLFSFKDPGSPGSFEEEAWR
jgi:hypothetical protein